MTEKANVKPIILAIGHRMRSGKDTLADMVVRQLRAAAPGLCVGRESFAKPLKNAVCVMLGLAPGALNDDVMKSMASSVRRAHPGLQGEASAYASYREVMQVFGVAMRDAFPGFWVDLLKDRVAVSGLDVVVISDLRFKDEARAVRDMGGIVVNIERVSDRSEFECGHISESALDGFMFDMCVFNNGSLAQLESKAAAVTMAVIAARLKMGTQSESQALYESQ